MSETEAVNLLHMRVVGQHGRAVGVVKEVLVNVETWHVECLEVKLNRDTLEELELKRPLLGTQTVRIPTSQVSGASDVIVLKAMLEDLEFSGGTPASDASEDAEPSETPDEV
jgi:sporulation protein YlmC with PRC-barrel domain